ncbi:MAG: TlpA family protein disulfide reductase [Myxococcota bacterium]
MEGETPAGGPGAHPESADPAPAGRPWAFWAGLAAVVAAGLLLVFSSDWVPPPLARGVPAPDFALPELDADRLRTLDEQRGRVVLVNFWATWCKPCEDEIPAMGRLYASLDGEPFEMLAVSVDDDPEPVRAFRDRLGIAFPILLDPDETVSRLYQTTGYPETILVDRDGRVVERYVGPKEWDTGDYERRIRALLESPGG